MTRGFFGLAAFFFLLITSAKVVGRTFAKSAADGGGAARFAAFAAIVAHVVHGLTHFTVGSSWIQIGFYVALGLGIGTILRQAEARRREPAFRVDPVAVGWGIVTVGARSGGTSSAAGMFAASCRTDPAGGRPAVARTSSSRKARAEAGRRSRSFSVAISTIRSSSAGTVGTTIDGAGTRLDRCW